ncbi:MAG: hypothetical protein ACRDHW_14525, partial [Ktedonobacteraceae bacterium]
TDLWFPSRAILARLEEIITRLADAPSSQAHLPTVAPQARRGDEDINEDHALANAAAFASAWDDEDKG